MRPFRDATAIIVQRTKCHSCRKPFGNPNVMSIISVEESALSFVPVRGAGDPAGLDVQMGGRLRRENSEPGSRAGRWRFGGAVVAIVYSAAVWGALFHGAPRMIAWIGQRQAAAEQSVAKSLPTPTPTPAQDEALTPDR
jgi:hypothetical protein